MNDLTVYNKVRSQLRAGDVIMLWGAKYDPLSLIIEGLTDGPSHCQIVRQPLTPSSDVMVTEATILNGHNGVQTNALGPRIGAYDKKGAFMALRLSDATRAKIDWFKFYEFIGQIDSIVTYDKLDLLEFLLRNIPFLGAHIGQAEHKDQMVCSSLVIAVLEKCGVLTGFNWTKFSPQDIAEMNIYDPETIVLYGNPHLKRFNSV